MDAFTKRLKILLKQYKWIGAAVTLGLVLMLIPTKTTEPEDPSQLSIPQQDLRTELESILSRVQGVGKVQVMLTQESAERYDYAKDEDSTCSDSVSDLRSQTVVVTNPDRGQEGLILQIHGPRYRGAVVVCQGGDLSSVRLAVVEAVSNATGLTTDKITVLKMK